jgi:hypothetical protein
VKVRSDSKNFKTLDQTESDFEIATTSATPALASMQASEDIIFP